MKKEPNILSKLWMATKFDAISLYLPFLYPFHSFQSLTTLNLSFFDNIIEVMEQFRQDLKVDFVREDLLVYPMRLMRKGHFRMMIHIAWPIQLTRMTMNWKKIEYSSVNTTTTTWAKFCKNTTIRLPENHSLRIIHREKWTANKTFPRTCKKDSRWLLSQVQHTFAELITDRFSRRKRFILLNVPCVERTIMICTIPSTVANLPTWFWSNVSTRNNKDAFRFDSSSQHSIDVTDKTCIGYLLEERGGRFP